MANFLSQIRNFLGYNTDQAENDEPIANDDHGTDQDTAPQEGLVEERSFDITDEEIRELFKEEIEGNALKIYENESTYLHKMADGPENELVAYLNNKRKSAAAKNSDTKNLWRKILLAMVNSKNKVNTQRTPLEVIVASNSNKDALNSLLGSDCRQEIEYRDLRGHNQYLLHFAIKYGRLSTVNTLFRYGFSPDTPNASGATPLHAAAWSNNFLAARSIIDRSQMIAKKNGKDEAQINEIQKMLILKEDACGYTPMHVAANIGHWRVAEELFKKAKEREIPMSAFLSKKTKEGKDIVDISVDTKVSQFLEGLFYVFGSDEDFKEFLREKRKSSGLKKLLARTTTIELPNVLAVMSRLGCEEFRQTQFNHHMLDSRGIQ